MSSTGDSDSKHKNAHALQAIGAWAVEDRGHAASDMTQRQEASVEIQHDFGHNQTREHICTEAGNQSGRKFLASERNHEGAASKACFSKYVFP
jgi:hypothetical protein